MFPGCDPFRTEEERPTMFFIQVPFPSRRHWVSECLPRNVNQPRFGLRVDAEIACVAKDHAPRQHRIVDAEGGWDGGVSQATEASMTLLTEATREHYEFTANVYMIPGSAYIRVRLQQAHNAYCKQHQPDNTFNAPVGFLLASFGRHGSAEPRSPSASRPADSDTIHRAHMGHTDRGPTD